MRFARLAIGMAVATTFAAALQAQGAKPAKPHTVIVKLVDRGGPTPYAFEPANVIVDLGDTVQFTEAANVVHNVRFTKEPKGAKLGSDEVGPYLMKLGDVYRIVVDKRFIGGEYTYVCEPHQMMGMKGTMIVSSR